MVVQQYDIDKLVDSDKNHFSRMEGEQWEAFVDSIQQYGILSPLIIRPHPDWPDRYEILSGHNRRRGAVQAGLGTVPCIVVDSNDVDASVLLGVSNQQRQTVSDLEWGWTYRATLEALKRQGNRQQKQVSAAETTAQIGASNRRDEKSSVAGVHTGQNEESVSGMKSIDIVARMYGVNRKTAQRKIRLTYLIPQLYDLGQKKNYTQQMLIDLSYLPPVLQTNVVQAVVIEGLVLTETAAAALRKASAEQALSLDELLSICRESQVSHCVGQGQPLREKKYAVPDRLFPEDLPAGKRQDYLAAALAYIQQQGIRLSP